METQLLQSSQICFLNWTNYIDSKHRIFFLHYLTIPSPCFYLLRCCDATRKHGCDVTKGCDVTITVRRRRSLTIYCEGTGYYWALVFSQWVQGNDLVRLYFWMVPIWDSISIGLLTEFAAFTIATAIHTRWSVNSSGLLTTITTRVSAYVTLRIWFMPRTVPYISLVLVRGRGSGCWRCHHSL